MHGKHHTSSALGRDITPASYGSMLSAERKKRGLSLQDAAHETRIHGRWLRLLEEGNVAAFGSMTYARSFIRAYSAFLGVNPSDYLETLPERGVLGGKRDYRYLIHSDGLWQGAKVSHVPKRQRAPEVHELRRIKCPIPAGLGVFALMLTATAMWGMHVADIHDRTASAASQVLPLVQSRKSAPASFVNAPHLAGH